MKPLNLMQLRDEVEEVDRSIINLIFQRQRVVSQILHAKQATAVHALVPVREEEVYRRILAYARSLTSSEAEEVPPHALTAIFREIMSLSMYSQNNPVFAYVSPYALQHVTSPTSLPADIPSLSPPTHGRARRYPLLPAYEPTPIHPRLTAPLSPQSSRSPPLTRVATPHHSTDAVETLGARARAHETAGEEPPNVADDQGIVNNISHPLLALKQRFGSSVTTLPIYCAASSARIDSPVRYETPQRRYLTSRTPYTAMRDALHAGAATYGLIPLSREGLGPVMWIESPRSVALVRGIKRQGHRSGPNHAPPRTLPRTKADACACGGGGLWADMVVYEAVVEVCGKHGGLFTEERSASVEASGVMDSVGMRLLADASEGERERTREATNHTTHAAGKAATDTRVCEEHAGLRIVNVRPRASALHIVCGVRGGELRPSPDCSSSTVRKPRRDEYVLVGEGAGPDAEGGRMKDGKEADIWVGHGFHSLASTGNRVLMRVVECGNSGESITADEQWCVICSVAEDVLCVGCLCTNAVLLKVSEGKRYVIELSNVWPSSHDFL